MKCYNRKGVHIKVNYVYLVSYLIVPPTEGSQSDAKMQVFSNTVWKQESYCTASLFMRRLVTCLAICEDAGVVPQEGVVQQTLSETLEHDVLAWNRKKKTWNENTVLVAHMHRHSYLFCSPSLSFPIVLLYWQWARGSFNLHIFNSINRTRGTTEWHYQQGGVTQPDSPDSGTRLNHRAQWHWPANLSFWDSSIDQKQ